MYYGCLCQFCKHMQIHIYTEKSDAAAQFSKPTSAKAEHCVSSTQFGFWVFDVIFSLGLNCWQDFVVDLKGDYLVPA